MDRDSLLQFLKWFGIIADRRTQSTVAVITFIMKAVYIVEVLARIHTHIHMSLATRQQHISL